MCVVIKVGTAFKLATTYFTINYNSDKTKAIISFINNGI